MPVSFAAEHRHVERSGLTPGQRSLVIEEVGRLLRRLAQQEGITLAAPEIGFDLSGTAAGQYRCLRRGRMERHQLRFNPYLLARHFRKGLDTTVPHEVAHYAVSVLAEQQRPRPHGPEWRRLMRILGAEPDVTHGFDLDGIPVKRQKRWRYRCTCRDHELSTTRHNRSRRGMAYLCTFCRAPLVFVGPGE